MKRIVKEHDERRNEILQAAQALFYTQGYDATSVQNIIDAVGIAKGTFYYYFDSKQTLLDELIARLIQNIIEKLEAIVADPHLDALQKLQCFFNDSQAIKLENKQVVQTLLQVLYKDENAILRKKLETESIRLLAPILARIIQQGIEEGCFQYDAPDDLAVILLYISQGYSEMLVKLIIENELDSDLLDVILDKSAAYEGAIERLLGAPCGTLQIVFPDQVPDWFALSAKQPASWEAQDAIFGKQKQDATI